MRDTGIGMDAVTQARAFEPFFTTKALGRGTGLGLSTVYGIVKQHEGYIDVESSLGAGTVVSAYLPRISREPSLGNPVASAGVRGGTETILVVEDEAAVREMTRDILREAGYLVLEASSPPEALALAGAHADIQLMLSDVVMPEMNGIQLAHGVSRHRPDLKVLLMSGYSCDVIDGLPPDMALVQKPFTTEVLLHAVRRRLDG